MEVDVKLADICGLTLQNKPLNIPPGGENSIYFNSDSESVLNVSAVTVANTEVHFNYIKPQFDQDKSRENTYNYCQFYTSCSPTLGR